jgi:hypothetical protein
MSTRVEIYLPDEAYHRAERLAYLTRRKVADVLADTVVLSLPDLPGDQLISIHQLTDTELLAVVDSQMPHQEGRRLTELLNRQNEGILTLTQQAELSRLMQMYQHGLLRKAEALAEAVKRGIHPPLSV